MHVHWAIDRLFRLRTAGLRPRGRLAVLLVGALGFVAWLALSDRVLHAAEPDVVVLVSQDLPSYREAVEGIKDTNPGRVREFNLQGDPRPSPSLLAAMERQPPNLVAAVGLLAARAATQAFPRTPVVFCLVADPERFSLSGDLITGVRLEVSVPDLFSRMTSLFPEAKRIGVLYDPVKTGRVIDQARSAARAAERSLLAARVEAEKDLPVVARSLLGNIDLLWMVADSTVVTPESIDFLLMFSFEHNIPIVTFSDDLVKRGAVAGVTPDYRAAGAQAGRLARRILSGVKPAEIPVVPVERTRLSINRKAAEKMGLVLDPKGLSLAEKIYE